jgi:hypothetical protein
METANFPPLDDAINALKKVDYVKLGEQILFLAVTIVAFVVAVVSYAWTALQLWYEDGGKDRIKEVQEWIKVKINYVFDFAYYSYLTAN